MEKGQNYSIYIESIQAEVKKMVHKAEDVVFVGGSHSLHVHEKFAIVVSKAMRGHSLQETKKDGRFHVHTKTYLDGAILKQMVSQSNVPGDGGVGVVDIVKNSPFAYTNYLNEVNDLSIQDSSGGEIRFLIYHDHNRYPVKSCRALANRGIIYVSRVKLVRVNEPIVLTYLKSTLLTTIVYEPDMPEADSIRNMVWCTHHVIG